MKCSTQAEAAIRVRQHEQHMAQLRDSCHAKILSLRASFERQLSAMQAASLQVLLFASRGQKMHGVPTSYVCLSILNAKESCLSACSRQHGRMCIVSAGEGMSAAHERLGTAFICLNTSTMSAVHSC